MRVELCIVPVRTVKSSMATNQRVYCSAFDGEYVDCENDTDTKIQCARFASKAFGAEIDSRFSQSFYQMIKSTYLSWVIEVRRDSYAEKTPQLELFDVR